MLTTRKELRLGEYHDDQGIAASAWAEDTCGRTPGAVTMIIPKDQLEVRARCLLLVNPDGKSRTKEPGNRAVVKTSCRCGYVNDQPGSFRI